MRQYATLFDHHYLPQGLALYESLYQHSAEPFTLNVLPMDDECERILVALDLPGMYVCRQVMFRSGTVLNNLDDVRSSRTYQEWCWTCASQFCDFLFNARMPEVTYLDADLFFFGNPTPIFAQIGERSIAITPHRLPENSQKSRLEQNGKYNVGFVHFKNTDAGRACLSRWTAQVRERCSAAVGCGDQVYLDDFEYEFQGDVCVLGHGINTGPWNLSAYEVSQYDGQVFLGRDPLYCYHFHEYKHGERLTNYPLRPRDIDLIYNPYIAAVNRAEHLAYDTTVHIRA